MTRLRAADVLPLVAAAAIPLIFLHRHYQAHASLGPLDVYSSDVVVALTVGCAIAAGFLFGWEPLRPTRWLWVVAAALLALFVIACLWTPIERPTKHLVSAGKIIEYALLAPSVVLLFRRQRRRRPLPRRVRRVGVRRRRLRDDDVPRVGRRPAGAPPAPRPGQREVSFLGHQDLGSFTGAALAVGLTAIALGTRRWLAVAAVVAGGIGVMLDASVFVYLGVLLGAVAIVIVARHLGTLNLAPTARGRRRACRGRGRRARPARLGRHELPGLARRDEAGDDAVESDVQTGSQRTMLLWMGYQMWKDHPILGIGFERSNFDFGPYLAAMKRKFPNQPPEAYPSLQNPWGVQNSWVELLADTGVVGFALGVATFVTGLWLGSRAACEARTPASWRWASSSSPPAP